MTFRACIVAAVSTAPQARPDRTSLDIQIAECRAACVSHGWQIVEEITIPGHSRDYDWLHEIIAACPEYAHLVEIVSADRVNLIVVRHYDRLWSRSALQAQLSALCRQHRCQIYSVQQPKEPLPLDQLPKRPGLYGIQETLSGVVRDEEQNIRVARHDAGMALRIRRGQHHPGAIAPYGYARDSEGLLFVVESEARWVRWIYEHRALGWSYGRIGAELTRLGVTQPGRARGMPSATCPYPRWRPGSVRGILNNRVYIGEAFWGTHHGPGSHEPIISGELFDRAAAVAVNHTTIAQRRPWLNTWLRGLVKCDLCEGRMIYHRNTGDDQPRFLRCGRYVESYGGVCRNNGHTAEQVHAYVLDALHEALSDRERFEGARSAQASRPELQDELARLRAALADCQTRRGRWDDLYERGAITAEQWIERQSRIEAEAVEIVPRLREMERTTLIVSIPAEALETFERVREHFYSASSDDLQCIARGIIQAVYLRRGAPPRIIWR